MWDALSIYLFVKRNNMFLFFGLTLLALSLLPYIGYRLLFYLQGPILLGCVNLNSNYMVLSGLFIYSLLGFSYTHPPF